ncbi:MAG: peptidoglycan-binding domain-containing protein [Acidobacteria bacterium]|nr:peptidoglycan-binding domain-containing protein [Acidobacteriota bacterium]
MEGCLVRAVRLLALFIGFCFLLVTADCVAGLMLYRYAPGWYEDLEDLASPGSAPARPPGADGREHERKLALDRPTRRLIQQGLANDGFDPGTPDGQFGPRTRAAIRAWQAARGAATTGYLDDVQAELLRSAAALQPEASTGVEGSEFFTRGSHQDEVLRLQGTPDSITTLLDSEIWGYGFSSVTISTRSREVTEWSNLDGNLRVRLVPGPPSSGLPRAAEPAPGAVFRPGTDIVNFSAR